MSDDPAPTIQVTRFRHHRGRAFASLILAISLLTLGTVSPWLTLLPLLPLGWAAWVWRSGTDVDPVGLRVHGLLGERRVRWQEVELLYTAGRDRVTARLTSGGDLPLTAVTAPDLPTLVAAGEHGSGRSPVAVAATRD